MRTARAFWRTLTSMRTALVLLLALAVAAVPGSVFPQRGVSIENVNAYLAAHPGRGAWLDRLGLFDVYSSPWFSAIYLLLFVSLVGCLVPRLRQHAGHVFSRPPDAPSRLDRLPHAARRRAEGDPGQNAAALSEALRRRRWRTVVRGHDVRGHDVRAHDGATVAATAAATVTVTVSAEKGYLKETGNLLFHFALLAVLVGVAWGSWYGWHGNRLLQPAQPGADFAFCNGLQQYDEYGLGARVAPSRLAPFCLDLLDFEADYLDNGAPIRFLAQVSYLDGEDGQTRTTPLSVNDPLRLGGANVYLLGHGYAPVLRYTDRFGVSQTSTTPFLPDDAMLTSSGVAKFPDANVDPTGSTPRDPSTQVAFAGVYLPTLPDQPPTDPAQGRSAFPAERDPALMLGAYAGNLGLGTGEPQSVYELSAAQIASGRLTKVAETMLRPGQTWRLPDGSTLEFVGTQQWITISVRHDPGAAIVLAGAVGLLAGLMVSLVGRRRRVWARITPDGAGGSLISLGGLTRGGDPDAFDDEFARVVALAGGDTDLGDTDLGDTDLGDTDLGVEHRDDDVAARRM